MFISKILKLLIALSIFDRVVYGSVYRGQLFAADQDANLYRMWNTSERGGNVLDPDSNQDIYALNNEFPGPLIEVQKGDQVNLLFQNKLQIATASLYFHGLSQCPLQPDNVGSYFYNFTADKAGTYWYHGDTTILYYKGLFGPLVVQDPDDPFKGQYQGEQIWFIHDFSNNPQLSYASYQSAIENQPNGESLQDTKGSQSTPSSKKLSKRSRKLNSKRKLSQEESPAIDIGYINGMWGNGTSEDVGFGTYQFPTFNVTQSSCFRLRVIAPTGQTSGIRMYIAQHTLKVIAHNSVNVEPATVSGIVLYSGERLDAIVCPKGEIGNYKIYMFSQDAYVAGLTEEKRDEGVVCKDAEDTNCWTGVLSVTDQYFSQNVTAPGLFGTEEDLIRGLPEQGPFYDSADGKVKLEMMMGPDNPNPDTIPTEAQQTISLYSGQVDETQSYYLWQDEVPFAHPYTPIYLSRLRCGLRQNSHVIRVAENGVFDVIINNLLDEYSPLHLHGNRFWLLGQDEAYVVLHIDKIDCKRNLMTFDVLIAIFKAGYELESGELKDNDEARCSGSEFPVANKPDSLGGDASFNASGCVNKNTLNTTNPFYSDTVVLAPQTYAYIRIRFDNPGPWLFQGYTQTHQEQGMAMVFAVGDPNSWPQPTGKITQCGAPNCDTSQAPENFEASYDTSTQGLLEQFAPDSAKLQITSILLINLLMIACYVWIKY